MQSIARWPDKLLGRKTQTVRSGPIYVQSPRGTITIVKEGILRDPTPVSTPLVRPQSYFIIDGAGVRRRVLSQRSLLLSCLVALCLVSLLFHILRRK